MTDYNWDDPYGGWWYWDDPLLQGHEESVDGKEQK